MQILQPNEYDISYFDGDKVANPHPAGYSKYGRWFRFDGENSLGEYWKDYANKILTSQAIQNKKTLELGCAYGFVVEDLRSFGVDAYGIDVSQYAYDQASSAVKPYIRVADIRSSLSTYKNKEFDLVYGIDILDCFTDSDIISILTECKRIGKRVVFIERPVVNADYYNFKSNQAWNSFVLTGVTILEK